MEGGTARDIPAEAWRDYQLVEFTGWTFEQIDAAPAVRLDWLLATHAVVTEVRNNKQKEASQ